MIYVCITLLILFFSAVATLGYYYFLKAITYLKDKSFFNAIDNIVAALVSYLFIIVFIYFTIDLVDWKIDLRIVLFAFIMARVIFACKELLWNHYLLLKNPLIITSEFSKITLKIIGFFDKNKDNNTKLIEKIKTNIISNTIFLFVVFLITWLILLVIDANSNSEYFKPSIIIFEILYYLIMIPVLAKKFQLFKSEVFQK